MNFRLALILLICQLPLGLAYSQAWSRAPGSGYVQIGYSSLQYGTLYKNVTGSIQLQREVSDRSLSVYTEVGVAKGWTVSAYLPYKLLKTGEETTPSTDFDTLLPSGALNALGNIALGVSYGFLQKGPFVASGQLIFEMNTSSFDQRTGLRSGYNAWTISPVLHAGYSKSSFFVSAYLGFGIMTNAYSSMFKPQIQAGVTVWDRLLIMGVFNIQQSFRNGNYDDGTGAQTGLYQNNQSFWAMEFKASVRVWDQLRIWLATSGGIGNLVARGPVFSATLSYEWAAPEGE